MHPICIKMRLVSDMRFHFKISLGHSESGSRDKFLTIISNCGRITSLGFRDKIAGLVP